MNKKVLVVYATKSGSTTDVAQSIRDTLTEAGAQATVKSADSIQGIETYNTIFIGSPMIYGKCMSEIKEFVNTHRLSLSQRTVAYFITCMYLSQVAGDPLPEIPIFVDPVFGDPKPKKEMNFTEKIHPVTMYLKDILGMAEGVKPVSVSFFRGVLDYSTIGFFMRLLFKLVVKVDGLEPGDYRNWNAIRSWTQQTYSSL